MTDQTVSDESIFSKGEEVGPSVYWLRPCQHSGQRSDMFSVGGDRDEAVELAARIIGDVLTLTRFVDVYEESRWGERFEYLMRVKLKDGHPFTQHPARPT